MIRLLIFCIVLSGCAHIYFDYRQQWRLTYIFKPLTMLLIIGICLLSGQVFGDTAESDYGSWMLVGLLLSLLGDIFLMLRPQKFVLGLCSFLLAHLTYVVALSLLVSPADWLEPNWHWLIAPVGIVYLAALWPKLKHYTVPVVIYVSAISIMVAFSGLFFLTDSTQVMAQIVLLGALLFALSDAILGYRKFIRNTPLSQGAIMTTYYAAQSLLALSVHYIS